MAKMVLTGVVKVTIEDNDKEYVNDSATTLQDALEHIKQTMELDSPPMKIDFEIIDQK